MTQWGFLFSEWTSPAHCQKPFPAFISKQNSVDSKNHSLRKTIRLVKTEQLYQIFLQHPVVSTDSRKIAPGSIFFALKGENFDGNRFAASALEAGAAFVVVDDPQMATHEKFLLVDDVLTALQQLAAFHRKQLALPVLAITGTNGKTTTKELVAAVLAEKFNVEFTRGNLNNHIGVPLTLLSFTKETQFGVVEMGANHPGEIDFLCRLATPNFGIITNVGKAHLEGFGSFEGVIQTKSELYRHLEKNGGKIFLNSDNPYLRAVVGEKLEKIKYGQTEGAWLRGETVQSPPFLHARIWFPKGVLYFNTRLVGHYNLENVLAAACVGHYFGIDPLKIKKAVENYRPSNNRSQLTQAGNNQVILDAYNANPTSMQAALTNFSQIVHPQKAVILGDMLELGESSAEEHQRIVNLLQTQPPARVFLVGNHFAATSHPENFKPFPSADLLAEYLQENPLQNCLILIKGSRGIRLEKLMEKLS